MNDVASFEIYPRTTVAEWTNSGIDQPGVQAPELSHPIPLVRKKRTRPAVNNYVGELRQVRERLLIFARLQI